MEAAITLRVNIETLDTTTYLHCRLYSTTTWDWHLKEQLYSSHLHVLVIFYVNAPLAPYNTKLSVPLVVFALTAVKSTNRFPVWQWAVDMFSP